jgi:hypothetical protein
VTTNLQAEPTAPPDVPLPDAFITDLIVLPREIAPDGRAVYDDSVLTIVKEFRAAGVAASYQHDRDSRTWIGEKSVTLVVLDLIIGIASNAGWSALCSFMRGRHDADHVRVQVGRVRKTASGTSWEWYRVEGPGASVAAALAAIESPDRQEECRGQEETAEPINP